MSDSSLLQSILQRARWAPSGDNTQPCRFELVDATHLAVHGFDTRDHVLYDFDGRASQLAHGALLETIRLAASCHRMRVEWRVRPDCPETTPIYDVRLVPDATIERVTGPSGLLEYVLQYTLIYSANEGIRKVEGSHNLIV